MEFLIVVVLIGLIPAAIAQSKGRSFVAWWIYGMAIFIIALPHSLLIKKDVLQIENEQVATGESKRCPFCAEIIKAQAKVCRFCGRDLPIEQPQSSVQTPVQSWRCSCGYMADKYDVICSKCGSGRPDVSPVRVVPQEEVISDEELSRRMAAWKQKNG